MTKARDLANASTALSAVDATELGYLDGVTSAVQTQLNAKAPTASPTFTGNVTSGSSFVLPNDGYVYWGPGDGSTSVRGNSSTDYITFNTASVERAKIKQDGNFEIGSSASSNVNGLRYVDLYNQDGTTSSSGINMRFITQQSGATALTSVDLVKYKNGTFVIQNNDTAGTINLGTGIGTDLTIAADGATTVAYTTTTGKAVRNTYMSTSDPSGGADGDVWIKYTA
jgi:hypothetical protein